MLQMRSHETSRLSSEANRSEAAFAAASIEASVPASRWRWSRSCSAVSTTEVTIPGRHTTPPEVQTAPPPASAAIVRSSSASLAAPASASRRLSIGVEPGVRRLAAPGDARALDAERPEHDAERQLERLEHRPLLDVELQVGARPLELRAGLERAVELDAVLAERVGQRDAVAVCELAELVLVAHRPGRRRGAEERPAEPRTFLVGPVDEADRDRRRALRGDPAQHLGGGEHVEAAVEPAAVRHRVQMAAENEGRRRPRRS